MPKHSKVSIEEIVNKIKNAKNPLLPNNKLFAELREQVAWLKSQGEYNTVLSINAKLGFNIWNYSSSGKIIFLLQKYEYAIPFYCADIINAIENITNTAKVYFGGFEHEGKKNTEQYKEFDFSLDRINSKEKILEVFRNSEICQTCLFHLGAAILAKDAYQQYKKDLDMYTYGIKNGTSSWSEQEYTLWRNKCIDIGVDFFLSGDNAYTDWKNISAKILSLLLSHNGKISN